MLPFVGLLDTITVALRLSTFELKQLQLSVRKHDLGVPLCDLKGSTDFRTTKNSLVEVFGKINSHFIQYRPLLVNADDVLSSSLEENVANKL